LSCKAIVETAVQSQRLSSYLFGFCVDFCLTYAASLAGANKNPVAVNFLIEIMDRFAFGNIALLTQDSCGIASL
jgi:hypothetical protein